MLHMSLVESSYWERNISGENLFLTDSDKKPNNLNLDMEMWIRKPFQFSWRAPF